MSPDTFILYTFLMVEGQTVCHAYGLYDSKEAATTAGEQLVAKANEESQEAPGYMVLALEPTL